MQSSLWGPSLWKAMFACAWNPESSHLPRLDELFLEQIPALLPCSTCRENYARHVPMVHRRNRGRPRSADHYFRWCWYLKDEVNKITRHPSISLSEVVNRYVMHGPVVCEVELADTLVLLAISAREKDRDDLFLAMCHNLSVLLPSPADSALQQTLAEAQRPVLTSAMRCARATRTQHGLPSLVLAHYRAVSE